MKTITISVSDKTADTLLRLAKERTSAKEQSKYDPSKVLTKMYRVVRSFKEEASGNGDGVWVKDNDYNTMFEVENGDVEKLISEMTKRFSKDELPKSLFEDLEYASFEDAVDELRTKMRKLYFVEYVGKEVSEGIFFSQESAQRHIEQNKHRHYGEDEKFHIVAGSFLDEDFEAFNEVIWSIAK